MNVLQRHIDVLNDLLTLGDGCDDFLCPVRWVGVKDANPKLALDRVEFAEQAGQRRGIGRQLIGRSGKSLRRGDVGPMIRP